MIRCNMTSISNGGDDPCHVGSITSPSNSLVMDAKELTPCTQADLSNGSCAIYCNTATFPDSGSLHNDFQSQSGIFRITG